MRESELNPMGYSAWLIRVLILATGYYVSGKLSLLLAIPPGYATAVWPPVGLALACLLLQGTRLWPGIFLGSFLVNIGISYDQLPSILKSLGLALGLGIGPTLQALAGTCLVRRFAGFPNPLDSAASVAKFLLLGGPISCLISPTIGIFVLYLFGAIDISNCLFSWGTWWVGDTIGVIIFTPLILVLIGGIRKTSLYNRISMALPLAAAFTLAMVFFIYASSFEQKRIRQEFEERATNVAHLLDNSFKDYMEMIYSIRDLYHSSSSKSWTGELFHLFTASLLSRHSGVLGLSWNPIIEGPGRKESIPISFIEPYEKNKAALGFDITSEMSRHEAVKRARDTNAPIATGPVRLIQENSKQSGFLVYLPVYETGTPYNTFEERKKNIKGFIAGIFQIQGIIETAFKTVDFKNIGLEIVDEMAPQNERLIYYHPIQTANHSDLDSLKRSPRILQNKISMVLAGRQWVLTSFIDQEFIVANRSWRAWIALAIGLLFTGFLGTVLLVLTGRASVIETLVFEKTLELSNANLELLASQKKLEVQQSLAIQSAKMAALGEMAAGIAHEINTPLAIICIQTPLLGDLILEKDFDQKEAIGLTKMIEETGFRISRIIRGLEFFSRESKTEPFHVVNLNKLIEDTLVFCRERFKNHGTDLRIGEISPTLKIECRPTEISQILLNLLNNANDAVENLKTKWIRIDVAEKGTMLEISVTDSGEGINPDLHEKIMQPFFTTKELGKGTGLGLSISRGILEAHQGTLSLDTISLHTRFIMSIPKSQNKNPEVTV